MEMACNGQAKAPGSPCVLIHMLLSCAAGLYCGNRHLTELGYVIVSLVEIKSLLKGSVMVLIFRQRKRDKVKGCACQLGGPKQDCE